MTVRDNRDYIWVLLYSYYTTITGWGVPLSNAKHKNISRKKNNDEKSKSNNSNDEPENIVITVVVIFKMKIKRIAIILI